MATRASQTHSDPVDQCVDTGDATAVASFPGDGAKGFTIQATFPLHLQVSTVADNAADFSDSQIFGREYDGCPLSGAGAGLAGTAQDSTAASSTAVESDMGSSATGGSLGTDANGGVVAKQLTAQERRRLVAATMPLRDMEDFDGLDLDCPLDPLGVLSDVEDGNVFYSSSFLALRSWLRRVSSAEHLISIRVAARGTEYEFSVLQRLSGEFAVVYDREDEEHVISLPWGLSRRARNRMMHALVGNGRCKFCSKGCSGALCGPCGNKHFEIDVGLSNDCREAARAARDTDGDHVLSVKNCKLCASPFDFTKRMASKLANHKSKAHYYGLDLCESCRAAKHDDDSGDAPSASPAPSTDSAGSKAVSFAPRGRRAGAPERKPRASADDEPESPHEEEEEVTESDEYLRLLAKGNGLALPGGCQFHVLRAPNVVAGDVVLLREFCEPYADDELLQLAFDEARYFRTGDKLRDVNIAGSVYPSHDWVFDPVPVSWQRDRSKFGKFRLVRASIIDRSQAKGVALVLARIESTTQQPMPRRHRFTSTVYKRRVYTSFRGSTISEITVDGVRRYVPSDVLGEVLRYFSNEANGKTSASHVMGQLKLNSNLAAEDIDWIIRYACAHHNVRAVQYAEAISGDSDTKRRVEEELAGRRDYWWLPNFLHFRANNAPSAGTARLCLFVMLACFAAMSASFAWSCAGFVQEHGPWVSRRIMSGLAFGSAVHGVRADNSTGTWVFTANCTGHDCSHIQYTYEELVLAGGFGDRPECDGYVPPVGVPLTLKDNPCFWWDVFEQRVAEDFQAYGAVVRATGDGGYKYAWLEWYRTFLESAFDNKVMARMWTHFAYTFSVGPFQVLYLGPIWEELFKRFRIPWYKRWIDCSRLATNAFVWSEMALFCWAQYRLSFAVFSNCGSVGCHIRQVALAAVLSLRYAPTAQMHRTAANLPLVYGIMYHMAWNHLATGFAGVADAWRWFGLLVVLPAIRLGAAYALIAWLAVVHKITAERYFTPGSAGPVGLLGAAGIALAVKAYNSGDSARFPRVEPAGNDSEFVRLTRDPEFESHFPMKESAELRVKQRVHKRTTNRLTTLMPVFAPGSSFARSTANATHSLAGRVLKETPLVTRSTDGAAKVLDQVSRRMGRVEPDDYAQWLSKFPPSKRNRYAASIVRIAVFGFAMFNDVLLGARNPWQQRSCFLKHEVNLAQDDKIIVTKTGKYRISSSDPRTIQASTDEVQSILGRYFTAYGRRASECFDGSEHSVICGWRVGVAFGRTKVDCTNMARSIADSGQRGIIDCGDDVLLIVGGKIHSLDAARWDAHVSRSLLLLKSRHLLHLGMPRHHVKLLERTIRRRGRFRGLGVSFTVDGDVASGDPDTLYWNTILGVCVIIDAAGSGGLDALLRNSVELGIEYEHAGSSPSGEYNTLVDFCSCVFTPSRFFFVLAPKLGRSLFKLTFTATTGNPAVLLASKIKGLCHDLCCFPFVVRELCRLLPSLPDGTAASESFTPMGKVEPASDAELDRFFSERYGHSLGEVEADVKEWVDRALVGDMEAGDLVVLRKLVEVDYGKKPRPAPSSRLLRSCLVPLLFFACMSAGDTQSCVSTQRWVGGSELYSPADTELSTSTYMTKSNKANKTRAPRKPAVVSMNPGKKGAGRGGKAAQISGDGLYKLLGPLAKLAVRSALPGALQMAAAKITPNAQRIQGSGDYVTNDIVHAAGSASKFSGGSKGVPVFKYTHSEYIQDVVVPANPAAFNTNRFTLNAADSTTFPWLSRLAALYTKYRFTKLLFEFRSNTSNYSAAGGLGTIVMAPHYNVESLTFSSKQLMEAATHAVSAAPSSSVMMGFECAKEDSNVKWFNVLNDVGMTRSAFTDPGAVEVATNGLPGTAGTSLGELWVHYSCDLIEPYISVTDAITTGPVGFVGGYLTTSSNLVNAMDAGFLGLQYSALSVLGPSSFPSANYKAATIATSAPTSGDWYVFCSADAGKQLGFRHAGTYALELQQNLSAAPTGQTIGAPYDLTAVSGSIASIIGNNSATNEFVWTSPTKTFGYRWVLTVTAGTVITSARTGGWTGTSTLNAPSSSLVVYKIA